MKALFFSFLTLVLFTAPAYATVNVSIPYNLQNVGPWIQVVATSSTTCNKGVSAMGVYINNSLVYVGNGASMNHWLEVGTGWNHVTVQEWDYCGGSTHTSMDVNAKGQSDGVTVTSPKANSTVGSQVTYVASGTSSCGAGVASMGIYVNSKLVYVTGGSQLNHQISLGNGKQHTTVQEWDRCGGSKKQAIDVNVSDPGTTLTNLQSSSHWRSWAEYPPKYDICTGSCPGVGFSRETNVSSPSYSGHAAKFSIWGTKPYADVLWNLTLFGDGTSGTNQDKGHTLLPSFHHFVYDTDVYVTSLPATEILEFDISMDMNGDGMTWGTQCNHLAGGTWDIWDNVNAHWVSAGVPCKIRQGWNHVTLRVERSSDKKNWLYYDSITMNGETYKINRWYAPYRVPGGWWGLGINYQMDGNHKLDANSTYLDNLSFNYW